MNTACGTNSCGLCYDDNLYTNNDPPAQGYSYVDTNTAPNQDVTYTYANSTDCVNV